MINDIGSQDNMTDLNIEWEGIKKSSELSSFNYSGCVRQQHAYTSGMLL